MFRVLRRDKIHRFLWKRRRSAMIDKNQAIQRRGGLAALPYDESYWDAPMKLGGRWIVWF